MILRKLLNISGGIIITVVVVAILILSTCRWGDVIRLALTYGWDNLPSHEPIKDCSWERMEFQKSGISLYLQKCTGFDPWTYSEDQEGRIVRSNDVTSHITMQLFTKTATQIPMDVVNDWYKKLTPEQQNDCEIQNADEPIEYSSNGQPSNFEAPHSTPHKTRYKIGIKQAIANKIESRYDGLPSDQRYDYLCGSTVGSQLTSASPYFEFDDRTPSKYLFIGSLGNDGSILVDLNSIRF